MLQNDPVRLPPFHFDADPDPAFHFDADQDPASKNDADPGPDPQHYCSKTLLIDTLLTVLFVIYPMLCMVLMQPPFC
jgi:hypothetical protein